MIVDCRLRRISFARPGSFSRLADGAIELIDDAHRGGMFAGFDARNRLLPDTRQARKLLLAQAASPAITDQRAGDGSSRKFHSVAIPMSVGRRQRRQRRICEKPLVLVKRNQDELFPVASNDSPIHVFTSLIHILAIGNSEDTHDPTAQVNPEKDAPITGPDSVGARECTSQALGAAHVGQCRSRSNTACTLCCMGSGRSAKSIWAASVIRTSNILTL